MIAELGHFVLVMALVVATVQAVAPLYLARRASDIGPDTDLNTDLPGCP